MKLNFPIFWNMNISRNENKLERLSRFLVMNILSFCEKRKKEKQGRHIKIEVAMIFRKEGN